MIITVFILVALVRYVGTQVDGYIDAGSPSGAFAAEEALYKKVTVHNGDTIWGIASEYNEPSKDIRISVKEICKLNDVEPGKIYPGQVLLVPVPASKNK